MKISYQLYARKKAFGIHVLCGLMRCCFNICSEYVEVTSRDKPPPSEPVRASVFGALVSQTISAQPQRREGRIHGLALPVTSVNPVTSCREHLINGVGSGCQKMSVPLTPPTCTSPCHLSPHHLLQNELLTLTAIKRKKKNR